jgi:hypothetical protein
MRAPRAAAPRRRAGSSQPAHDRQPDGRWRTAFGQLRAVLDVAGDVARRARCISQMRDHQDVIVRAVLGGISVPCTPLRMI